MISVRSRWTKRTCRALTSGSRREPWDGLGAAASRYGESVGNVAIECPWKAPARHGTSSIDVPDHDVPLLGDLRTAGS